jgi:hypothetical protein
MDENSGMKEQAQHFAEQQKDSGAEKIGGVAKAIHGVAQGLEAEMPQAAAYVHDAAGQLQQAAAKLHESTIEELLRGAGRFAREQPAVFFGGAVLAGFALSRFLKSSAVRRRS